MANPWKDLLGRFTSKDRDADGSPVYPRSVSDAVRRTNADRLRWANKLGSKEYVELIDALDIVHEHTRTAEFAPKNMTEHLAEPGIFDKMSRLSDKAKKKWRELSSHERLLFTQHLIVKKALESDMDFRSVLKGNPYRDEAGKFTSKDKDRAPSGKVAPSSSNFGVSVGSKFVNGTSLHTEALHQKMSSLGYTKTDMYKDQGDYFETWNKEGASVSLRSDDDRKTWVVDSVSGGKSSGAGNGKVSTVDLGDDRHEVMVGGSKVGVVGRGAKTDKHKGVSYDPPASPGWFFHHTGSGKNSSADNKYYPSKDEAVDALVSEDKRNTTKKQDSEDSMSYAKILKANPYRDEDGKFTSKDKDADGVAATGASNQQAVYEEMTKVSPEQFFGGVPNRSDLSNFVKSGVGLGKNGKDAVALSAETKFGETMVQLHNLNRGGAYFPIRNAQDIDALEASFKDAISQLRTAYGKSDARRKELMGQLYPDMAKKDEGSVDYAEIMKGNPYHDKSGQFTSKDKDADGAPSGGSGKGGDGAVMPPGKNTLRNIKNYDYNDPKSGDVKVDSLIQSYADKGYKFVGGDESYSMGMDIRDGARKDGVEVGDTAFLHSADSVVSIARYTKGSRTWVMEKEVAKPKASKSEDLFSNSLVAGQFSQARKACKPRDKKMTAKKSEMDVVLGRK